MEVKLPGYSFTSKDLQNFFAFKNLFDSQATWNSEKESGWPSLPAVCSALGIRCDSIIRSPCLTDEKVTWCAKEVGGPSVSDIKAHALTRSPTANAPEVTQHQDLNPGLLTTEQLCIFSHSHLTLSPVQSEVRKTSQR